MSAGDLLQIEGGYRWSSTCTLPVTDSYSRSLTKRIGSKLKGLFLSVLIIVGLLPAGNASGVPSCRSTTPSSTSTAQTVARTSRAQ